MVLLNNLRIEMLKRNISTRQIARIMGICEDAARNKIHGRSDFKLPEAIKLRDALFPDQSIEHLFESDDKPA